MKNWPWYGYIILCGLIFGLVFIFYFKPKNGEIKRIRAERQTIEQEVQDLRAKKLELDKIEAELIAMNKQLKELEVIIPQKKEISDILRRIQQLAFDARLNIIKFAPRGEIKKEFFAEWPIPIEVSGSFHNLGAFFDSLSRFSRIFTIENFSIRAVNPQTEALTITSGFTAKTYYFLDDATTPPATPGANGGRP
jgi:type IV pilus assembly protein PilO